MSETQQSLILEFMLGYTPRRSTQPTLESRCSRRSPDRASEPDRMSQIISIEENCQVLKSYDRKDETSRSNAFHGRKTMKEQELVVLAGLLTERANLTAGLK